MEIQQNHLYFDKLNTFFKFSKDIFFHKNMLVNNTDIKYPIQNLKYILKLGSLEFVSKVHNEHLYCKDKIDFLDNVSPISNLFLKLNNLFLAIC